MWMLTSVFVCPVQINENWSRALGQGEARMFPWRFHLMEIQCWVGRLALRDMLGIKNVIHRTHYHALAGNCNMLCKWPQFCTCTTKFGKQGWRKQWGCCGLEKPKQRADRHQSSSLWEAFFSNFLALLHTQPFSQFKRQLTKCFHLNPVCVFTPVINNFHIGNKNYSFALEQKITKTKQWLQTFLLSWRPAKSATSSPMLIYRLLQSWC